MRERRFVAVLSSPIVAWDGTYESKEIPFPSAEELYDVPHYVGHPATRQLLDSLGAIFVPGRFGGLAVGEAFLAVPLASNPREGGVTKDEAISSISELKARLVVRIA